MHFFWLAIYDRIRQHWFISSSELQLQNIRSEYPSTEFYSNGQQWAAREELPLERGGAPLEIGVFLFEKGVW